ncbi:hypothetical protein BASA60_010628 [Batrachochytrium salamandrivorans]|nr:hypothetical protein BASA60_010628 [Batrachochytrium salamandrivorans]
MKVAAATILSLVATAAYASPTAYSETQEVGTHDSTTESSADSYLEKRGGGFYGNYAQGAGGVHHAPPNHWNHGSHKTGGHHQYPQTPNPSRLYGSNQPRHRTPPRDLGPYEKLRHDQQQQQQQQQQQHHHHQQQYQQQYHHQHHHHQQHQHHHQHHQQQHHQQKSALQQYQEQRRRQHQQHQQQQQQRLQQYQLQLQYRQQQRHQRQENNSPYNQGTSSSHEMNQNAQPVEGGNNEAEVDVETGVTESGGDTGAEEGGAYGGDFDTINDQPQGGNDGSEDEENGQFKPENDNNPESRSSGSDVVTASGESEDQVTGSADGTKTGDDDEVKPEVEGETNEPEAKKSSLGDALWGYFKPVLKKKFPLLHTREHDQYMTKTSEQSTNEDTGSGDGAKTGETVEVEDEDEEFSISQPTVDAIKHGLEKTLYEPYTKKHYQDMITASKKSIYENAGPGDSTRTEETVEFKPESGAKPEDEGSFEYGPFGSDVVTAGGKSEDEVTGPETNTETEETVEFKPESGADGSDFDNKNNNPEGEDESNGPEVKPEDNNNFESGSFGSDVVTADDESTDEGTGPEKNTESEDDNEVEESGTKDSEYDTENNQLQREGDKPEGEPENDNNPKSGPSGSDAVTASGESEDQVTEPETNTKTGDDDKVKPEGETNEPGAKKFSFGKMLNSFQQVFKKKPHSTHSQEHDQDMAKTPEQSTDEDTGSGDSTRTEETVEFKPESGADGGDFDTENNNPEGGNGGLEVKLEDDNNFESGPFGSDVVTAGGNNGAEVDVETGVTESGGDTGAEESGTNGGESDTINDQPQGGNDGSEDEENGKFKPENNNNFGSELSGSSAETAGEESEDKSTGPEYGTETGDDDEFKPDGETNEPEANKFSFGKMLGTVKQVFGFKSPSPHPQEHDQDMAKTPEQSTNEDTGPGDSTKTEENGEVEESGAKGGESNTGNNQPEYGPFGSNAGTAGDESGDEGTKPEKNTEVEESGAKSGESEPGNNQPQGEGDGPEVKSEDNNNFDYGSSGSDAETADDESGDEDAKSGDDAETGDGEEVKLESGANGGEPEPINDQPQGGNDGSEDEENGKFKPENNNNFGSELSGSSAETAGEESEDKSTGPEYGTETGDDDEFKPEVETTQYKTKRPSLSRSMAESVRQILNKPFPSPNSRKRNQDMAKTSEQSKVEITGPGYGTKTEETVKVEPEGGAEGGESNTGNNTPEDESNEPEDESNGPEAKPENDNNPKSGTSESDAETAGEKSGDKSTGPGDDAGTKETGEVEESGAKGGESETKDNKLEDGAAKPKADRDSAFKLPWDSFMQERRSRVYTPQVALKKAQQSADYWVTALDPGVENIYTWLRGGVLNGEADLNQRWLDGTVEHESMGTRHDNRALAARLADFLQAAYRQYQSTLWKYHWDCPCESWTTDF